MLLLVMLAIVGLVSEYRIEISQSVVGYALKIKIPETPPIRGFLGCDVNGL